MKKLSDSRRVKAIVAAGFTLPLLILLYSTLLAYRSIHVLDDSFGWVSYSQKVKGMLNEVLASIKDVESGQRGYMLSGREDYLQPYGRSRAAVNTQVEALCPLFVGNMLQEMQFMKLKPLIQHKMEFSDAIVDLKKAGRDEDALQMVMSEERMDVMKSIDNIIGKMRNTEESLLQLRESAAAERAHETEMSLMSLLVLDGAVLFIVLALLVKLRRLEQFVTVCAWSKMVRQGDEWLTIEQYLQRHHGLSVSHGISDKELEKFLSHSDLDTEMVPAPAAG
jgi:CHASE3 domain sensor protein